jgi:hypothetical protein
VVLKYRVSLNAGSSQLVEEIQVFVSQQRLCSIESVSRSVRRSADRLVCLSVGLSVGQFRKRKQNRDTVRNKIRKAGIESKLVITY